MKFLAFAAITLSLFYSMTAQAKYSPFGQDRTAIAKKLVALNILDKDRILVHYSHSCNLEAGGKTYPVIYIRELIRGAMSARGQNRTLIFSPDLSHLLNILDSSPPLYCDKNRLYFSDDSVGISGDGAELLKLPESERLMEGVAQGNTAIFSDDMQKVHFEDTDSNSEAMKGYTLK